jgi:methylenetetrahydrofolate--tRNA-(uracil-5-)-methyltransferase
MVPVTIIGGGLAGSEAAWQLALRGYPVRLYEMRPRVSTPAHRTGDLAELVCSNSLKSVRLDTASGMLKEEMTLLGSLILDSARASTVPAGDTLAVDREVFARRVTESLSSRPEVTLVRDEVKSLPRSGPAVVGTGPLTSPDLAADIERHLGSRNLAFYDAIAPSVAAESIDTDRVFRASRYDKGEADYWNCPLDREEYLRLVEAILAAAPVEPREFEDARYFEACLPIEVLARRGIDTLRHGPMRPVGLRDPATGRRPYAVVQLRQEKKDGSLLGLVGFQTRLRYGEQKQIFRLIPGLEKAEFLRFGSIHRNTFLNSPQVLDEVQQDRSIPGLFYAGQLTGVEGYVESTLSGLTASLNVIAHLEGFETVRYPRVSMCGALQESLASDPQGEFQPHNANFGILPVLDRPPRRRSERRRAHVERGLEAMRRWIASRSEIFSDAERRAARPG